MKAKKKWIILIAIILLLIIAGLVAKNYFFSEKSKGVSAAPIQTMDLTKGTIINSITASGTIYSAKTMNVCSSVTYPVEEIRVNDGDKVKAGQIMAVLHTGSLSTDLDKAQLTLDAAERDLTSKSNDYENNKVLYEEGAVSLLDLNNSLNALENAKDTYHEAETNQNDLKKKLTDCNIVAPISGTVTESNAEVGLAPSGILFVVEDAGDLYVAAKVKEFSISKIKVGQEVQLKTNVTGNNSFKGTLSYISPKAVSDSSSTNVEFEIKVKISNPDPLMKIGMNAFLDIIVTSKDNVYSVSYDTVVTGKDGQSSVYALKDNTVIQVSVKTGIENDTNIEIIGEGLQDGMKIVTNPGSVIIGQKADIGTDQAAAGKIKAQRANNNQSQSSGTQTPPAETGTPPTRPETN
ncbi:efflux RND transporter periplasmic adaptor subunit [Dehalobacter sp.]|uniref:efflux RND transporter periplasmic adaptor subunit n=1 Tax=Dehalobacter sp. TaxID=1962289 RepID=UPI00258BFD74|nr:efflux RND transporter periplasmic adaptor subunit [Dehalobacter sp.]MCG1024858.1 efflux RND transporter periplasmic adaptor subunit [Dehalobacter sp.]